MAKRPTRKSKKQKTLVSKIKKKFSSIPPRLRPVLFVVVFAGVGVIALLSSQAAGTSTITGVAFYDNNRNGVQDAGEAPIASQRIYVVDLAAQSGTQPVSALTDANGHYVISNLADSNYKVEYDATNWESLINDWVPSTLNGSLKPRVEISLVGSASVNFGWRQILKSADLNAPIATYTGPSGLKVDTYNDAVKPQQIYDDASKYLVGAEAPTLNIKFAYGTGGGMTTSSYGKANGLYSGYSARVWIPYGSYVKRGDQTLGHEYGHGWAGYYSTMVQQDDEMKSYIKARNLEGDTRLNTSYSWTVGEMIAEDYRQLFGSANAAAADQVNREIPLAKDVPGLKDFLQIMYRQAPAVTPPPQPEPTPLTITNIEVSPNPILLAGKTNPLLRFNTSEAAKITVDVLNSSGAVVKNIMNNVSQPGGTVTVSWDRKDSRGRKVKPGTYGFFVKAITSDGRTTTLGLSDVQVK